MLSTSCLFPKTVASQFFPKTTPKSFRDVPRTGAYSISLASLTAGDTTCGSTQIAVQATADTYGTVAYDLTTQIVTWTPSSDLSNIYTAQFFYFIVFEYTDSTGTKRFPKSDAGVISLYFPF